MLVSHSVHQILTFADIPKIMTYDVNFGQYAMTYIGAHCPFTNSDCAFLPSFQQDNKTCHKTSDKSFVSH